jgi:hypothetical protein
VFAQDRGLAIDQTRRHLGTSDVDGQHDSG